MAGPYDLTGQNIENTYQRILQTPDGSTFYDGTGSLVNVGGNTFPYTGSAIISGSLTVTGSIYALDITGSLYGTSSWASTASYVQTAQTASYVLQAVSASFATSGNGTFSGSFSGSYVGNGSGLTGITAISSPAGPNKSIQFNDGGSTSGSANFTFDKATNAVSLTGGISASSYIYSTLDIDAGRDLRSNFSSGDEGGQIFLNKSVTNTTLNTGVNIDINQNKVRIFETGGTNRGGYFDISTLAAGAATDLTTPASSSYATSASYAVSASYATENQATSGVGTSPTATQTDTVTHSLGRTPVKIRIYGAGGFTSNTSATPVVFSIGTWTSSGNRCIYQAFNTAAITTTQAAATSTSYAVRCDTGANSFITGVIQNVTSTTFDIAWTETGTSAAKVYMWEAE